MNIDSLLGLIHYDAGLSPSEKAQLLEICQDKKSISKFLSGAAGATVSIAIAKYVNLSKAAQILLGVAGYGIGRLIYDQVTKHHKQFATYNDRTNSYVMDSSRY
ncbi:hypothetical protein CCP3SC5AM1_880016 [Gammaproteobacteria bacterium]